MRLKFKQLEIGTTFRFASEQDMPFSGMERGPWVKTGQRTYEKPAMKCKVSSVNVDVLVQD